jgi:hypothetical protein
MSLWAGQGSPLIKEDDARELLRNIVRDVDRLQS